MTSTVDDGLRAVVRPAEVRRAQIRRFIWEPEAGRPRRLGHGGFDPEPAGRLGRVTAHRATTSGGDAAWLYRGPSGELEQLVARHRGVSCVSALVHAEVPAVLAHDDEGIWIARHPRTAVVPPTAASAIDRYVAAAIAAPVLAGAVVVTGQPGVRSDGAVVVEEGCVVLRLEADQRALLRGVVSGLLDGDARQVVHATAALCGARPPDLVGVATRSVLSVRAARTGLGLGLGLHVLASAAGRVGPGSDPLVFVADEVLHRLDFAHGSGCEVRSILDASGLDGTRPTPVGPRWGGRVA